MDRSEGLTYNQVKDFMTWRIGSFVTGGSLGGAAVGYYVGDLAIKFGGSCAVAGGFIATQFFGGVLLLRAIRSTDDIRNYAVSGGLTCVSTMKYFETIGLVAKSGTSRGLQAVLVGSIAGVGYKLAEKYIYGNMREAWIENRVFHEYLSAYKSIEKKTPRPLPRELMGRVKLQEGMTFRPDPKELLETPSVTPVDLKSSASPK